MLSLAIDRDLIRQILGKDIYGEATYNQLPYARDYTDIPGLGKYLRYDPNAANRMLDSLGLTQRDGDGFRVMKDGRTMSIIIEVSGTTVHPSIEIVAACWNAVGLKTTVKPQDRTLNDQRLRGGLFMATPDSHDGVFSVLAEDTRFAMSKWGGWCWAYAMWYRSGGESGVEPPEEVKGFQKIYELMQATDDREVQKKLMAELVIKHDDSVWYMPLMQTAPYVGIAKNEFRNVPVEGVGSFITYCPGHFNPEQFFFKR